MSVIFQGIKSGRPQFQMEKGPPKWLLDAIGGRRLKDASPAYVEDGQFRTKTKVTCRHELRADHGRIRIRVHP